MAHSTAAAPAQEARAASTTLTFRWPVALAAFAFLFLWLEIVNQLQSEWSLNPQYSYGWTVPFLAAGIFLHRWLRRPPPTAPRSRGLTIALGSIAAAILFPARLVAVANPDWRLLSWTMALAAVVVSLCAVHFAGGRAWLKHFAFPILFFLVAVPWPTQLEQQIVQSLMRADSAITIQLLNLAGTLAVQHGNVIELSTGPVGIDDACTGVRSLQATFMIALFLGEFYRMKWSRRFLLVVAGAVLAFLCNIGRTFLLCEIAASSGIEAIHRWHDPAGYTILLICLFALWAISLWLKPATDSNSRPIASAAPGATPSAASVVWLSSALILWILLTEVSVAAFYQPVRNQTTSSPAWIVTWPSEERDYRREAVPAAAQELLRYNEGGSATWLATDGQPWLLYSFRWLPGRTAALFVKNHRPDICLPASGLTMTDESGVHLLALNGVQLPIRFYRFEENGRPLHVAYSYWDGRSSYATNAAAAEEDWTVRGRLRAAWEGKREVGARMLELAVWGYEDDAAAREALKAELRKLIRPR
jgi:exosortase